MRACQVLGCRDLARFVRSSSSLYLKFSFVLQSQEENKKPKVFAKKAGYAGIDYEDKVYNEHHKWISEANKLGLISNVWTVNHLNEIKKLQS